MVIGIMKKTADHDIPEEETGGWCRREDGAGIRNGAQRGVLGDEVGGKNVKVAGEVVFEHGGMDCLDGMERGAVLLD
jgi:hypothetical protein